MVYPRWLEAELTGPGLVTTDLHGDIEAFLFVEDYFRSSGKIRWWIDLGDRFDVEKRRQERFSIPADGDMRIVERVINLKRDISRGTLKGKQYIEILGNHDARDLEVYKILRDHHLLSQRGKQPLSRLLAKVAGKEEWIISKSEQLSMLHQRYGGRIARSTLEDPGLSQAEALVRFLIRAVYCQHGFAMRMHRREFLMLRSIQTLAVHLPVARIVLAHGGIPTQQANPEELANAPEPISRCFYWNRYPDDFRPEQLESFLDRLNALFLIVGHTPPASLSNTHPELSRLERGVALSAGGLITFTSGYGAKPSGVNRTFLQLDASKPVTSFDDIETHTIIS